jgi:type VII secretion effector (TIGR04197 family)
MEVNMDEEIQKIITMFNAMFGTQCLTIEQFKKEMSKIQEAGKKDKDTIAALEAQVEEMKSHKELAGQFMTALRQDVTRLKKIANKGELDPVEETTINSLTYDSLIKTQEMLEKRVDALVPMQCGDCGSTNVTRQSSVEKEPEVREETNSSDEKPQKVSWGKPATKESQNVEN